MVLVQGSRGPARITKLPGIDLLINRHTFYAKGGQLCLLSQACGRPPMLGVTVHPTEQACSSGALVKNVFVLAGLDLDILLINYF